ncbi:hypothetical protein FOZ61_004872 [Perkinsus olseni]|uniref:Uncharacterized protein n=1 Tax=Perkinsus olseni TaxID=32597 RepID=A0A7J6LX94_PEROL|nr:hypothetical protein FOZ61_004872 [Perkinsus olseni]KAF4663903.1 hypothetical protein FOL46_004497 [Perkinsus olseni]
MVETSNNTKAAETTEELPKGLKLTPAQLLPFVGWCILSIKDEDGHMRQIKGSYDIVPFHATVLENGDLQINARLSYKNPLKFLSINNENNYYFSINMMFGAFDKKDGMMAMLAGANNEGICDSLPEKCSVLYEKAASNGGSLVVKGDVPFAGEGSEVEFKVSTKEVKLQTRVSSVSVVIPKATFDQWKLYHEAIHRASKRYEEDDSDKKKDDDKKGDSKKTPEESSDESTKKE